MTYETKNIYHLHVILWCACVPLCQPFSMHVAKPTHPFNTPFLARM